MTLQDYLRVLRERWLVVVIATLLGVAGAGAYFLLKAPEYTAKLTMYVSSQGADTTQAAFQGAQLSQDRVASYTELVTGPRVATDVISRLQLLMTPDQLSRKMVATSKLESVLIDLSVTDADPKRAAAVANAVGEVFPSLVAELERPTDPTKPAAVAVRVVQPAPMPQKPSSTGLTVVIALGLLAGMAIGVGGALARNALDVSVKSADQLRQAAGAPNLGTIAHDSKLAKSMLPVDEEPQSPRAEALRQLRTNLQFVDVDHPRRVIVITSALPGEGKTTTAATLALVMGSAGSRVLLVEADLRRPRLTEYLGLDRSVGLTQVLSGRVPLERAIQPWGGGLMDVLASGQLPPNPSELLASQHMRNLLQDLRGRYDTVLLDTPPLLPVTDAAALAPATDGVLLVCRYKKTSRPQVEAAAEALRAVSAPPLGTVLTMAPATGRQGYGSYDYGPLRAKPEAVPVAHDHRPRKVS